MTLQQLDDVLKVWKTRLSAIAENLLELQTDVTFQSLTGTGGLSRVPVRGATAVGLGSSLSTMHVLFEQFGLLQATVDKAEQLRSSWPSIFGAEARMRELQQLLFTRSIELQAKDVPLAERQLLSGAQIAYRIAPEELLELMTRTFAQVRDAVAVVARAWAEFSECSDRLDVEMARLRSQRMLPSRVLAASLDSIEAMLTGAREQVQADPVGALCTLRQEGEPALARVQQRLVGAEQTVGQLHAARVRWGALQQLHGQAKTLAEEAKDKFIAADAKAEIVPQSTVQGLGEWLTRLEQRLEDGAMEAVAVGLRNWSAAAEACFAQDGRAVSACEAHLSSRGELRGRLNALKAKAHAYGLAESQEVLALCGDAEQLLYARPLDLGRAAQAVAQFELRLRTAGRVSAPARSFGPQ